jgi:hypothetical protein
MPLNPLEMLSMTRDFLEKFYTSDAEESVPAQLINGLGVYENNLRKQVESKDIIYPQSDNRIGQGCGKSEISYQTTVH